MTRQTISIRKIILSWSAWVPWSGLAEGGDHPGPPQRPGVYEVRKVGVRKRLTIGMSSNLRTRVVQALVRGQAPHSSGKRIRKGEIDKSRLQVRWAETDRAALAEVALLWRHKQKFNGPPLYARVKQ